MEIVYQYSKQRRQFGRPTHFSNSRVEGVLDARPDEEHALLWRPVPRVTAGTQVVPSMCHQETNTSDAPVAYAAMDAAQGNWPKDVDPTDAEAVTRYRRKVERDETYVKCVARLGSLAEESAKENNALDLYTPYFGDLGCAVPLPSVRSCTAPGAVQSSISVVSSLVLPAALAARGGRPPRASALAWSPEGVARLAALYDSADPLGAESSERLAIWDASRGRAPERLLQAPAPPSALTWSPRDASLVAAGLRSGALAIWDIRRAGASPALCSGPGAAHAAPVSALAWPQSRTWTELCSAGADGWLRWWDVRSPGVCTDSLVLAEPAPEGRGKAGAKRTPSAQDGEGAGPGSPALPATCLDCSPAAGAARWLAGTAGGLVLHGSRRLREGGPPARVAGAARAHWAPVVALARCAALPKYHLTAGGWGVSLWSEEVRAPLLTVPLGARAPVAAVWAPQRAGTVLLADAEGRLAAWDLARSRARPAAELNLVAAEEGLACLQWSPHPRLFAVGTGRGGVRILALAEILAQADTAERSTMAATLERDGNRERLLEKNARDARIRAKREELGRSTQVGKEAAREPDPQEVEAEFFRMMESDD